MSEKWGEARGAQILLNSYIYDYMLKNAWSAAARAFMEVAEVPLSGERHSGTKEERIQLDTIDGLGGGDKDTCLGNSESKGDASALSVLKQDPTHTTDSETGGTYSGLLQPAVIPVDTPGGFLLEWWTVFWDIFNAKSGKGGSDAATAYFAHAQKMKHEQQRAIASMGQPHIVMINPQTNSAAFNPAFMRTFDIPNGMVNVSTPSDTTTQGMDTQIIGTIPLNEKTRQALMRQAMNNNIRRFSPSAAQIQQLKNQQFLQNQQQSSASQIQRNQRDLETDVNGQAQSSRSPALSNQVLSPSKRQKLSPDGSYTPVQGTIQTRPQMIQNNLAAASTTLQTQQAKQMLLNSGISPVGLTQQQFTAFQSQSPSMQQRQLQEYTQNLANQQQRVINITKGQVSNQGVPSIMASDGNEIGPNDFYGNILSSQQNCATNANNHTLEDYQMQLMFLEQQNKKRLMMTHQDQERLQSQDSSTFQILSPQGVRNVLSPKNNHNDTKPGISKVTHQNGPNSPTDGPLTQQSNVSRNTSPNVATYNGQIQSDTHPQIMFFNQTKAIGDMQNDGMIINPNGHIIRSQIADQAIYTNNPQLQIAMINGRPEHLINPRIVRTNQPNAIWQQQQIMQHLVNQNQNRNVQIQNMNHSQGHLNQHSSQNQISQQPQQQSQAQLQQLQQSQSSQLQQQQIQTSQNILQSTSANQTSQGHIQSSSPIVQNNVSPTPSQINKSNLVREKKGKDTRKSKKTLSGAPVTPISESSSPGTPITSHNTGNFTHANSTSQGNSLLQAPTSIAPASESMQTQIDPPSSSSFANIDNGDPSSFLNDFSAGNDLDLGMMNDFDFDSFLEDIRRC